MSILIMVALMVVAISFPITSNSNPGTVTNQAPNSPGSLTHNTTPMITITEVDYHVTYITGPFTPTAKDYLDAITSGGMTITPGSMFTINITLTSHAFTLHHTVDSVSISPTEFVLISAYPLLPSAPIAPGSTIRETLTMRAPQTSLSGPLIVNLSAS
jgi:hypothetical protein